MLSFTLPPKMKDKSEKVGTYASYSTLKNILHDYNGQRESISGNKLYIVKVSTVKYLISLIEAFLS